MAVTDPAPYLQDLKIQKDRLVDYLVAQGVTASKTELFNTLIPKILHLGSPPPPPTGLDLELARIDDVFTNNATIQESINGNDLDLDNLFEEQLISVDWSLTDADPTFYPSPVDSWHNSAVGNSFNNWSLYDLYDYGHLQAIEVAEYIEGPEFAAMIDIFRYSEFFEDIRQRHEEYELALYVSEHTEFGNLGPLLYAIGFFQYEWWSSIQSLLSEPEYQRNIQRFKEMFNSDWYGFRVEFNNGLIWYLNTKDLYEDWAVEQRTRVPVLVSGCYNRDTDLFMSSHIGPFFITNATSGFQVRDIKVIAE